MNPLQYLLAAALLTNPNISARDLSDRPDEIFEYVAPAMQWVAIGWEVMDIRETDHILVNPREFEMDLKLLRGRFQDLANAPPLFESQRFPGRELINDLLTFNRRYREDLERRLDYDQVQAEEIRAALLETDQLYRVWNTVRDIQCKYYYVTVRRQALAQLRDLIGDRAYYSGNLPPYVPLWRLPRMR